MKTNGKTKAVIRLLVMVVLAVNAALTVAGKNPIPFDETTFTEVATQVAAGLSALWAWWKNNMTDAACVAQGLLDITKGKTMSNLEEEDAVYDDEEEEL